MLLQRPGEDSGGEGEEVDEELRAQCPVLSHPSCE